jgi:hypothetical protein
MHLPPIDRVQPIAPSELLLAVAVMLLLCFTACILVHISTRLWVFISKAR